MVTPLGEMVFGRERLRAGWSVRESGRRDKFPAPRAERGREEAEMQRGSREEDETGGHQRGRHHREHHDERKAQEDDDRERPRHRSSIRLAPARAKLSAGRLSRLGDDRQ